MEPYAVVPASHSPEARRELHHRWAPDLEKDPVLRFLDRTFLLWQVVIATGFFVAGYVASGLQLGISLLVWGYSFGW